MFGSVEEALGGNTFQNNNEGVEGGAMIGYIIMFHNVIWGFHLIMPRIYAKGLQQVWLWLMKPHCIAYIPNHQRVIYYLVKHSAP